MITKPMLAATIKDPAKDVRFPCIVSPKLDGICCIKVNGKALTRSFKPIPNKFIRTWIEEHLPDGVDGEIMIPGAPFNEIQSQVMSYDGEPEFEYHVFDLVTDLNEAFVDRLKRVEALFYDGYLPIIKMVKHVFITNLEDLLHYEQKCLIEGFEGIMVRNLHSTYKVGRSTLKEGGLTKLKRFEDSEARIVGFTELEHNGNEAEVNELGLTKRSSKKEGKIKSNTLGSFVVQDIKTKVEFEIGTGLTEKARQDIWDRRDFYLGRLVKYKYQQTDGVEKPRFPVFLGFRDERDL